MCAWENLISSALFLALASKAECCPVQLMEQISEWGETTKMKKCKKRDSDTKEAEETTRRENNNKSYNSNRKETRTWWTLPFRSSTKRIDNRTINILAINIVAIKCHNILYAFESSTCVFSLFSRMCILSLLLPRVCVCVLWLCLWLKCLAVRNYRGTTSATSNRTRSPQYYTLHAL